MPGVKIKINASDLLKWSRFCEEIPKRSNKAIARAMNAFGEQAVGTIVQHLAQKNNWQVQDILHRIIVKQATPGDLTFVMDASLVMPEPVDWQRPWLSRSDTAFEQNTLVKVITVDDGYDCDVCRKIAEEGPYTMQQITDMQSKWFGYQPTGHIHAPGVRTNLVHPNCRCVLQPWSSYRRLAVSMQGISGSVGSAPQRLMTVKQLANQVKDEMRIEIRAVKRSLGS